MKASPSWKVSQLLDEIENFLPGGVALAETPGAIGNRLDGRTSCSGEVTDLPREKSGDQLGWYHKAPFAVLTLICEPFYEGPEEEGGEVEGADPLLELEIEEVKGDVDARTLAILTDTAEAIKRYAEVGIESRYYDPENPTPLLIEGDELDVKGVSGEAAEAPEWAHSSKVVKATGLDLPARDLFDRRSGAHRPMAGDPALQGQLNRRVRATRLAGWRRPRGYASGGGWVRSDIADEAIERFLDLINVPQATLGGQRWEGRIEAYTASEAGEDTIEIDHLENMPAERWVQLRAPTVAAPPSESAGPKAPGTAADGGEGEGEWQEPDKAKAEDGEATKCLNSGPKYLGETKNLTSNFLNVTNFGFAIPEGATIVGINAEIRRKATYQESYRSVADQIVSLVIGGERKATDYSAAGIWDAAYKTVAYGGSADLWGETPTPAQLNAENFGIALQAYLHVHDSGAVAAEVDHVRITVYFTEDPDQDVICHSTRDLRIDSEEAERYDSTGTYLATVPSQRGGRLKLPPSGSRDRAVRVVTKMRASDAEAEASDLADSKHRVRVTYIPAYRFPANA